LEFGICQLEFANLDLPNWDFKIDFMKDAYIVAGFRTAVAKSKRGGFRFTRPDDLAVDVIKGLLKTLPALDPARVDDVIVGNAVPEAEQGLADWAHYQCAGCGKRCARHDGEPLLCKRA
jgi:hypothetical protein